MDCHINQDESLSRTSQLALRKDQMSSGIMSVDNMELTSRPESLTNLPVPADRIATLVGR